MANVKIALLGSGRMGSIRGKAIVATPGATLAYVVDTDPKVGQALADQFNAKFTTNVDEALPHVDAVWISAPTEFHGPLIKKAAAAGKIVGTEKPVAFTHDEIAEVFDVVKKNNVSLTVGFNRRSDPHFETFKKSLDIHKPAHILRIVNRDHPIPAAHQFAHLGSIWEDFLIHDFDTAVWLIADKHNKSTWPTSIYAVGSQLLEEVRAVGPHVLDTALVSISFPNGTLVSIEASRYSPGGYDQRLEAITRTATILADNPLRTTVQVITAEEGKSDVFEYSFPQRYGRAYAREIEKFVEVCHGKATPAIERDECLLVAKLVEAAAKSHQEKRPVQLKYD